MRKGPPCGHDTPRCQIGKMFIVGRDCRPCWLFEHDDVARARWGGDGPATHVILPAGNNLDELEKSGVVINRLKPTGPVGPIEKAPGWFRRAANFAGALVKHAWYGLPQTPTPEQERRIALCLVCEHLDPTAGTCLKCGCNVVSKSAWAEQKCPIGRW